MPARATQHHTSDRPADPATDSLGLAHRMAAGRIRTPGSPVTYTADARAARDDLVAAHLGLVTAIARGFTGRGLPVADLIQDGTEGLLRALARFDPTRGTQVSTYATWWIRQAMVEAIRRNAPVPLPAEVDAGVRKVHAISATLASGGTGTGAPAVQDIAEQAGMTPVQVGRLLTCEVRTVSADALTDAGTDLPDTSTAAPSAAVEQDLDRRALRADLTGALAALDPQAVRVLQARLGWSGAPPMTLQQVGDLMGLTRVQVRALEAAAITALREHRPTLAGHR